MKNTNCPWLPETVGLNEFGGNFEEFYNSLWNLFIKEFGTVPRIFFKGLPILCRVDPKHNGKPESFYHLTHRDFHHTGYEDRSFDLRRSERMHWIRAILNNYKICDNCRFHSENPQFEEDCSGILIWERPYRNTVRPHIFLPDEKYLIVLEKREEYYLMISAFYVDVPHQARKLMKEYKKSKRR